MPPPRTATRHPLEELGFTALESAVYDCLLDQGPATGYAIARAVGKANANVYKALESLEAKGAVLVDDGASRVYRAIPAAELLRQLEASFAERRDRARSALARTGGRRRDDGIYRMATPAQVLERTRTMIAGARFAVLADGDAPLLAEVASELEAAAAGGVHVLVKTYDGRRLAGVRTLARPRPGEIVDGRPGTFATVACDGRGLLVARFSHGGEVQQAIWTASPMLAFQGYMGLINELTLTAIMRDLESGASLETIRRTFERDRPLHPVSSRNPVYDNLIAALGPDAAPRSREEETA